MIPEDEFLIRDEELRWDLITQLIRLRHRHGLSQRALAERINATQEDLMCLEDPSCDQQSLQTLRAAARALDAFVDIILVPLESVSLYRSSRWQPVLDKTYRIPGEGGQDQ